MTFNIPRFRLAATAGVLALGLLVVVGITSPAEGAYHGANGKIVLVDESDDIWVANADGSNPVNLTNSPLDRDQQAKWSPDGSKIIFSSDRDGDFEIYTMDPDGLNVTQITINGVGDFGPDFSPDGSMIAFWTDRNGDAEIFVMQADGSGQNNLTNNPLYKDQRPAWSPDGSKIAFWTDRDGNREVYVMNADGTNPVNLTNNGAQDVGPDWSPDGTKIAFTTKRDGNFEIYVMNADGSSPLNLTTDPADDRVGAWGPDGSKLIFGSKRVGGADNLFSMNADGSNPLQLTSGLGAAIDSVIGYWQPVNRAPVAVTDTPSVAEGGTVSGNVTINDYDLDTDPFTAHKVTDPAHGTATVNTDGVFTYTHDGSETVSDSFTYRTNDGQLDSTPATVSITVTPVNDAPVAVADTPTVAEGATVDVAVVSNDTDAENDPLTALKVTDPAHGTVTLAGNGAFTYIHDGSETVSDSFTYRANDGDLDSDPATVSITVTPVNDAPVAVADKATVAEGGTVNIAVVSNDTDAENDPLTAHIATGPAHGTVTAALNNGFTYTHDGSNTAADSFTYYVTDPDGLNSGTVTVDITVVVASHTVGLQDPGTGRWHLRNSAGAVTSFLFGNPGDIAFIGDWDCDGDDTPGLYRQADGFVYLRNSNTQGIADTRFFFGDPGDIPIAGDFNGDGCDTVSLYRPLQSQFFIVNTLGSNDGGLGAAEMTFLFGNPGDTPFVGDFDNDGIETVGLHRESTGFVYYRNSHTTGTADAQFYFGDPDDRIVAGDWTGSGPFTPAAFRPSNATFYFRYTNATGPADATFPYGEDPFLPVSGVFGLG